MEYFLEKYAVKFNKQIKGFDKKVNEIFLHYTWPGNVRELENFIERAVALENSNKVTLRSIPTDTIYSIPNGNIMEGDVSSTILEGDFDFYGYIDDISKKIILKALELNNSNIKKTAEVLKLNYRSLRYLIEKYNLK
jgi:transcriptional regulator with PAS, ATPase and Fis domain